MLLAMLFLACLLQCVHPVFYAVTIENVKKSQHRIIDANEAYDEYTSKVIPVDEFRLNYNQHEKEIILDGEYYEVVSYSVNGDKVNCTLFSDDDETRLQENYLQQEQNHKKIKTITFWWPVMHQQNQHLTLQLPTHIPSPTNYSNAYTGDTLSGYLKNSIQPPEII